ncbi:T9SS type A sorting domain-containing protein [bacterium]|nr:T9SS type A sorting domain-containing protein [bacterium]
MKIAGFNAGMVAVFVAFITAGPIAGQYRIGAGVFGCGGGTAAGSGIRVYGTPGQVITDEAEGPDLCLMSGFWHMQASLITDVETKQENVPAEFRLERNYPNPFNPNTTIAFSISGPSLLRLEVYNVFGEKIRTLISDRQYEAGRWKAVWDGRNDKGAAVSSGIYFFRLTAGSRVQTRKMMLVK